MNPSYFFETRWSMHLLCWRMAWGISKSSTQTLTLAQTRVLAQNRGQKISTPGFKLQKVRKYIQICKRNKITTWTFSLNWNICFLKATTLFKESDISWYFNIDAHCLYILFILFPQVSIPFGARESSDVSPTHVGADVFPTLPPTWCLVQSCFR